MVELEVLLLIIVVIVGAILGTLLGKLLCSSIMKRHNPAPLEPDFEDTDRLESRATGLIILASHEKDADRRKRLRREAYTSLRKWDRRKNGPYKP